MSDKKDFSKQRLSDFLAARLRAKGHDESQAQKSRRDSVKPSPNPAEKRTPPSGGILRPRFRSSSSEYAPLRGLMIRSCSFARSTCIESCDQHSVRTVPSCKQASHRQIQPAGLPAGVQDDDRRLRRQAGAHTPRRLR